MRVEIDDTQSAVPVDGHIISAVRLATEKTVDVTGFGFDTTVDVVLTDDAGIRALNLEHRGKDEPTDVLSFPMLEFSRPLAPSYTEADSDGEGGLLLGSIAVSLERVRRQAKEYGHGFERELGFAVVHGMLHLLGYCHDTPDGEREMFGLQESVLGSMGLGRR